jgi:hypothetical protein
MQKDAEKSFRCNAASADIFQLVKESILYANKTSRMFSGSG